MQQLWWFMFVGSRGGETRVRLVLSLHDKPKNLHQLSQALHLDYKTVQHHMRVLEKDHLVQVVHSGKYGATYFLSDHFCTSVFFKELLTKFGGNLGITQA